MATFGIEEEFVFLDPATMRPADVAGGVFDRLAESPEWKPYTHREFLAAQIEHASAVFTDLDTARTALVGFRREIAGDADRLDVVAASVGTSPDAMPFPTITKQERYQHIVDDMGGLIADHQMSGLHVHVGIPDRESGIVALNTARPWLPLLTAITGNSPFWRGYDTGYDSWRSVQQRRWTTAGGPPIFADAADYDRRLTSLLGLGGMKDRAIIMWDIRLSSHLPTIEFRMADAQLDVEATLLVTALCRALVNHAIAMPDAAEASAAASQAMPPELLGAAAVHSAHTGTRAKVWDPASGGLAPAGDVLRRFLRLLEPALAAEGDLEFVTAAVDRVLHEGTGAYLQRAAREAGGYQALRELFAGRLIAG